MSPLLPLLPCLILLLAQPCSPQPRAWLSYLRSKDLQHIRRNSFLTDSAEEDSPSPRRPPGWPALAPIRLPASWGLHHQRARGLEEDRRAWPTLGPITMAPAWGLGDFTVRPIKAGYWDWSWT